MEIKNKINKKIIFIPEVKIKTDQLKRTKSVWPRSGCKTKNKTTIKVIDNVKKYFKYKLEYFSLDKIKLIATIKNGLTISIGWNLGNKYKSIHLLDPFTSTPINGTKTKKNKEIKKRKNENLNNFFWSIEEKLNITIIPKKIKIKCLKKNE